MFKILKSSGIDGEILAKAFTSLSEAYEYARDLFAGLAAHDKKRTVYEIYTVQEDEEDTSFVEMTIDKNSSLTLLDWARQGIESIKNDQNEEWNIYDMLCSGELDYLVSQDVSEYEIID